MLDQVCWMCWYPVNGRVKGLILWGSFYSSLSNVPEVQWFSTGGGSTFFFPYHEIATQIYSTQIKALAHFLSI